MTFRVVGAALGLSAVLAFAGFRTELLYPIGLPRLGFNSGVPASAPFAVLFFLTAMGTWLRLRRQVRFTRRELLAIFAIVLAGAPLVSYGIIGYMLPHAIYLQYAAGAHPEWGSTFLPLVPTWFSPTDPVAVRGFFEGGGRVPWSLWWTPLAAWCSFLLALVVASSCLALLFQKQWITHERLSFPLAQVPLGLVTESDDRGGMRGRLPVARAFWVGLLIAFGVQLSTDLHSIFPSLPAIISLGPVPLMTPHTVGPMAALGEMDLVLWPWLVAVAYLIPKELSFSCWFFWGFRVLLAFIAIAVGVAPQSAEAMGEIPFPAFGLQGLGAVLALSLWAGWRARGHLSRAVRIALSRSSGRTDADEPIPYRWLLIVLLLSYGWMVCFCCLAGARLWVGMALIGLVLMFYLMWTWLRAETGLGLLLFPISISEGLTRAIGDRIFLPQEIVVIWQLRWTNFPGAGASAQTVAGNVLEGVKIADAARIRPRPLVYAMAGGLLISLATGAYVTLTGLYRHGFYGLQAVQNTWLASQVVWGGQGIPYALGEPSRFDPGCIPGTAAGGLVAIALGLLRLRFWWWPLHPVGFLAANSWGMQWYYMPFFVGWLAKAIVTRYGGLRLYTKTVPLAVGLVGGDLVERVLWALFRVVTHGSMG